MLNSFSQSKMKVLFSTTVFAMAAIGGVVGQLGRSLDRQGRCDTPLDALKAIGDAIQTCAPDKVIVM